MTCTLLIIYELQTVHGNVLGISLNSFFLNIKPENTNGTGREKLLREKITRGVGKKGILQFSNSAH